MAESEDRCTVCGTLLPPGADACPSCGTPVEPAETRPGQAGDDGGATEIAPPPVSTSPGATELSRRILKLQQWSESATALNVTLPSLPNWAEEIAREPGGGEGWIEVARGVERLAQKRVISALEEWDRSTRKRLARLEAYSVDGRLERDQMDDVLHSARTGDVGQALATFNQVEKVVTLKERHLDQARDELERLVSLFRDMEALGMESPEPPAAIAETLERELRSGRLAALKQRLRALRQESMNQLKRDLPEYVARYGEFLLRERTSGLPVELESTELARGAREFVRGRPEEALRRLRLLAQVHGSASSRDGTGRSRAGDGETSGSTGASRTA